MDGDVPILRVLRLSQTLGSLASTLFIGVSGVVVTSIKALFQQLSILSAVGASLNEKKHTSIGEQMGELTQKCDRLLGFPRSQPWVEVRTICRDGASADSG